MPPLLQHICATEQVNMDTGSSMALCDEVPHPPRIDVGSGVLPSAKPIADRRGFTLIELLIVVVIIGILASIAIPRFGETRQKAYNAAVLSDLKSAAMAIEDYFAENYSLPSEAELTGSGFGLSPDVTFRTYAIRDGSNPDKARVHIHLEHAGSLHYYHYEYPGTGTPEKRWK
jgi:prepilin-type N-terminal cleavage/methylation domain-containing protein